MIARLGVLVFCLLSTAADPVIEVSPDVDSGLYAAGKTVTWTVQVKVGSEPASGKISYVVRPGGTGESARGEAELEGGKAKVSATRETPGTLLAEIHYKPEGATKDTKDTVGYGGAAFDPDQVRASAPPPEDFEQFWKEHIGELQSVPMNVELTPVDIGDPKIEYVKITMDNIRGSKIHGQIARPAGKEPLPALLQVQYAGVYPLQRDWVVNWAKKGWLSMNIIAHDLPIDEKPEFYKEKAETELKDYPVQGADDREKSYFLRMFLSCYRAVDYLTKREDWNKRALVVHGGSQGGYQAIVTAGMHPDVTAYAADVPAGCDHTGKQAGRAPGWPNWAARGKDPVKALATSRYFDAMNFAKAIRGPGIVGIGLIDTTCPPEGIYATVNEIKPAKKVILMPQRGHGGDHGAYYAVFGPFLEEQRKK
jgi:cephalosporin-C deacetylase-like acetyl esterase